MAKTSFTRKTMESRIESDRRDTQEKNDENEKTTLSDAQIERSTLDSIDGGTEEAYDEACDNIKEAMDVTSCEFEESTNQLNEIHNEIEKHKENIQEGVERANNDIGNIEGAITQLSSDSAAGQLEAAKETARRDIELLERSDAEEEEIERQSAELNQRQKEQLQAAVGK